MTVNDIDDHHVQEEGQPRQARAGLVALCLVGVLGLALAGVQFVRERMTTMQASDCVLISDRDSRLDCYDAAAHHAPVQPARGSNAPPS